MNEKIKDFKDLKIWQKSMEIVMDIYNITKTFPREETYGITSQMRRSAVSIPSNIAEGFKRHHNKEYKQFLYIALGSSAELETHLILAENLKYVTKKTAESIYENMDHLSRMITTLRKKLD